MILFAASSTSSILPKLLKGIQLRHKGELQSIHYRLSFGASSTLARQISEGARADIFISAHSNWMDFLVHKKLISEDSRKNLFRNSLLLATPASLEYPLPLEDSSQLEQLAKEERYWCIGDPKHLPLGIYSQEILLRLKLWKEIYPKKTVISVDSLRNQYKLQRGECSIGIVYKSNVSNNPKLRVIYEFPKNLHTSVVYQIGIVQNSSSSAYTLGKLLEKEFLDRVGSELLWNF